MRYPDFLTRGGRIGFIAPSYGCVIEPYHTAFEEAQRALEQQGAVCVLGPNCFASDGIGKSSTPEKCGGEVNDFFCSDKCDAIISCGGGETMCEDLPYIDFKAIAAAPAKWYMGYSDNTNLTFTLPTLCDTAAVYGPCAASFGMKPWHASIRDAWDLLCGARLQVHSYALWERESLKDEAGPFAPYNAVEPSTLRLASGDTRAQFSGRLIGGCMDCLATLCGTPYDRAADFAARYAGDGIVWFLESCDLNPMGVRRALWQMDQAGWFAHASGFLIGRPLQYGMNMLGMDMETAVTGVLGKYGVPIVLDCDIGHLPPMMPLISGACAEILADGSQLRVKHILK